MKCAVCRRFRRSFFYRMAGLGKFKIAHIDAKGRARRDDYGALNHILKFSYVSRPLVSAQGIHCHRRNRFDNFFHTSGKLLREVPHQQWNIPLPFPQGRDVDRKDIHAEKEIRSELLLAHHRFQIPVRRGNQAGVCPECARASQTLELSFLQHAQQLSLQFEGYFSNFVQKNRATVGYFEPANALCDRSGECAFLVSEQLAFQQACRNGRAVELHEGFRPPWTQIMNGAGDQFLSRPRLAINQDRGVRWRYSLHMFEDFAQRGTVSNDLSKIHFCADFIFQIQLLFGELVFELPNLPKGKCILHGNGNLICDLRQKFDVASERIVLIFDHTECAQHATSANKRKDADSSNFALRSVLHSQPPRLLDAAAPEFAGAKHRSGDILIEGDKALLLDGFVAKGKIQGIDPQVCVVAIGKSDANAIAAHNPACARHYGSENVPELEIGNHMIGQLKKQSNTLALLQQLLL